MSNNKHQNLHDDIDEIPLRYWAVAICDACIDGQGEECHTPGCALWLHKVDLPIDRNLLVPLNCYEEGFKEFDLIDCCDKYSLRRLGSGSNEVESWGCYKCSSCNQDWYCYANRYEPWSKEAPII